MNVGFQNRLYMISCFLFPNDISSISSTKFQRQVLFTEHVYEIEKTKRIFSAFRFTILFSKHLSALDHECMCVYLAYA